MNIIHKKAVLLFLAFFCFVTASCRNSEWILGEASSFQNNNFALQYVYFTGQRQVIFEAKDNSLFTLSALTNGGQINAMLYTLNRQTGQTRLLLYKGEDLPTGEWTVELNSGDYLLEITAKKHVGGIFYTLEPLYNTTKP